MAKGFDPATVKRVEQLLYVSEYKRRQAAARREDQRPQFRPRPPLSHHQCLPRRALMDEPRQSCYAPPRKETPVRFTSIISRTFAICG